MADEYTSVQAIVDAYMRGEKLDDDASALDRHVYVLLAAADAPPGGTMLIAPWPQRQPGKYRFDKRGS